jgi:hypothetical protein
MSERWVVRDKKTGECLGDQGYWSKDIRVEVRSKADAQAIAASVTGRGRRQAEAVSEYGWKKDLASAIATEKAGK